MLRARVRRGLRWGALSVAVIVAAIALTGDPADARARRKRAAAEVYQPAYASIVVDANSGAVLQSTHADSKRHPASLAKIMTLYLLFERLEAGKIKLNDELKVTARAAAQAPSKLALKPGETIQVETAIRAIVTKSANDIAVVVAETLAGDENEFAKLMTQKARALGMKNTVYKNASGLPDDAQVTTARDQALLGRAIQERFPRYYKYFSTREFHFRGKAMRNHNMLLGHVAGVDGIKTGYINASGFNIVTSVRRGNRHIVAAVFGGRTASARDARMHSLIEGNLARAAVKHTAPAIAETAETTEPHTMQAEPRTTQSVAAARTEPAKSIAATVAPRPGSTEPIKPHVVKTVTVKAASMQSAALAPLPSPHQTPAKPTLLAPKPETKIEAKPEPKIETKTEKKIETKTEAKTETLPPAQPSARLGVLGVLPVQVASANESTPAPKAAAASTAANARTRGGWMIQVGALENEGEAKQRLEMARNSAKSLLGGAEPFTEPVTKGDKTLYRARFSGLNENQAEAACKELKRSKIACMPLKN